jgi:hypothetical protein
MLFAPGSLSVFCRHFARGSGGIAGHIHGQANSSPRLQFFSIHPLIVFHFRKFRGIIFSKKIPCATKSLFVLSRNKSFLKSDKSLKINHPIPLKEFPPQKEMKSGLQRDVLKLYKDFLKAIKDKPRVSFVIFLYLHGLLP